jgi:glycosyltransferase involved in cell wall biosynthesis
VCGEAADLLDPDDAAAWRDALRALRDRPELRAARAASGLERAATLTWVRTARGLLEVYRAAARRPSARI